MSTHIDNILNTIIFFFSTDLLKGFVAQLKVHRATKKELSKETLIRILENNRSRIPAEKYEFILKYLLVDETIQPTLNYTSEQKGSSLN